MFDHQQFRSRSASEQGRQQRRWRTEAREERRASRDGWNSECRVEERDGRRCDRRLGLDNGELVKNGDGGRKGSKQEGGNRQDFGKGGSSLMKELGQGNEGVNRGLVNPKKQHGIGNIVHHQNGEGVVLGSNLKRYVSFYFTNFPAQMSNFYLRKGFEVCGMLEDVYVAKKRNIFGQPYGFVKFSNVRNITKMTSALNAVWFGHFRVRASVAKFERNDDGARRRPNKQKDGLNKGVDVGVSNDGKHNSMTPVVPTYREESTKDPGKKTHHNGVNVPSVVKDGSEPTEGVRVGDIVVKLGVQKEKLSHKQSQKEEGEINSKGLEQSADFAKNCRVFMRSYQTKSDDVKWARNCVVATVINGEAISVVQNRILDAGFKDLVLIPMGADRVFVRSMEDVDAMTTLNNAKEFFQLVFSIWTRWDKEELSYRRGAWVRLYGIPIHAWNEQFFKLCVLYCGSFLRTDNDYVEKGRLDFARVLIATPDLDIIKRSESVLVNGTPVVIKIVEEWGYAMGEDACLFEEESESEASQAECCEGLVDPEIQRNVDLLANKFKEDLEDEDRDVFQGMLDEESLEESVGNSGSKGVENNISNLRMDAHKVSDQEAQTHPIPRLLLSKRTNSCPPEARRSVMSGPWSLEWLQDQNHEDAGVIFSASKKSRKGNHLGPSLKKNGEQDPRRRRAGGLLRHPVHSLKKVVRMPSKDRCVVLKVLKKSVRQRRGGDGVNRSCTMSRQASSGDSSSSGSVNNDWQNWVAIHDNDQLAVDDVWG
ncbi:uncharacterized protein LOC123922499 [Trifolium pratense]|uniref:uncharacterized protein LOC123922499 n=1 Tax=Trifolium pratense TaxID=57577 RepID=UPI001E697950|nr:uncharacterized protein LOC123922499 [Trifolium pratense]